MKDINVKDLMVPLSEYASVDEDATLYDAVLTLEKTQTEFSRQLCPHRALLVVDKDNRVVGRISQWDVIRSLEPKYKAMGNTAAISRAGFSPDFLKSMISQYSLWDKSLLTLCTKAANLKVKDIMFAPLEDEIVDENATLDEAIHALIIGNHHSLLVTGDKAIVGILLLPAVFNEICEKIKTCVL